VEVESKAGLAGGRVRAVAVVAVVGEDRLDIAAKIDGSGEGIGRENNGAT